MSAELLSEAVAHHHAGRLPQAEQLYRRILAADPHQPDALHLLGLIAHGFGHHDDAAQLIGQAISLRDHVAVYHQNLAEVLAAKGDLAAAAQCCRRAMALEPTDPAPSLALARFETAQGDMAQAAAALRHYLDLRPDDVVGRVNLGESLRARGHVAEAAEEFRRALIRQPESLDAAYGLGLCLLSLGEMEEGARLYERGRFGGKALRLDGHPLLPKWDGSAHPDGTLLLNLEQGAGDVLQFIRYVPWLKERVGRLVLPYRPELHRLLAGMDGIEIRLGPGEAPPPCDAFVPLISLLDLFKGRFPADESYLAPDPALVESWRRKLHRSGRPRVGLVWAGNPGHHNDRNRSFSLELADALLARPDIAWHGLQVGPRAADIDRLGWRDRLADLAPGITDFADTAAAIAALDLVITVDTAVAHLAGAMGRPAWVLIPHPSDWRWVVGKDHSDWYPSLRLFRQQEGEGWAEVLARIAAALDGLRPPAG